MLQIIGGFPFTTDIVLITGTGTDIESSQEERVSMLTGFTTLLYNVQNLACIFVCAFLKKEKNPVLYINVGVGHCRGNLHLMLTDIVGVVYRAV